MNNEKRHKINNFKDANTGSYYNQIKTQKPEITTLSWMSDPKYNNIIIEYLETGIRIVLDDTESLIWRYIFNDLDTVEKLVDFTSEKGIEPEKTIQTICNMAKEGIITMRSNSIWEDEGGVEHY